MSILIDKHTRVLVQGMTIMPLANMLKLAGLLTAVVLIAAVFLISNT